MLGRPVVQPLQQKITHYQKGKGPRQLWYRVAERETNMSSRPLHDSRILSSHQPAHNRCTEDIGKMQNSLCEYPTQGDGTDKTAHQNSPQLLKHVASRSIRCDSGSRCRAVQLRTPTERQAMPPKGCWRHSRDMKLR